MLSLKFECFTFCVMKVYPEKRPKSKWVQGAEKVRGPGMTSLLLGPLPCMREPPGGRGSLAQALTSSAPLRLCFLPAAGALQACPQAPSGPPRAPRPTQFGAEPREVSLYPPTVSFCFAKCTPKRTGRRRRVKARTMSPRLNRSTNCSEGWLVFFF